MSLRYRRSVKIAPGVKINLNKKSASVSVGGKGFHKTYNTNGQTTTSVNLPVNGLSYTERKSSKTKKSNVSKSNAHAVSSSVNTSGNAHAVSSSAVSSASVAKEKKLKTTVILQDKPDFSFVVFGIILLIVGFFVSGSSIPAGVVIALIGVYFIYCFIAFKRRPDNEKYITEEQLQHWGSLVSSDKKTVRELQKASLPILSELKSRTDNYYNKLSYASTAADIEKCSELLLNTQQKLVELSEFITIQGDEPQKDFEKYSAFVSELK